jgi:hypothetical protein
VSRMLRTRRPGCGCCGDDRRDRAADKRETQTEIAMEQAIHQDEVEEFYRLDAL